MVKYIKVQKSKIRIVESGTKIILFCRVVFIVESRTKRASAPTSSWSIGAVLVLDDGSILVLDDFLNFAF